MSPDDRALAPSGGRPAPADGPLLRLAPRPPLRVVDVALFYGGASGGIRAYLHAKAAHAVRTGAFEHHVVVPGEREHHLGRRHELRALRVGRANGYRVPLGTRRLKAVLRDIHPDVVLLHDPFWGPHTAAEVGAELGAVVVAVHHAGVDFSAAALPGPDALWRAALRTRFRRAYGAVDAIMSGVDTLPDSGRVAKLPLRLGLDPAFRPQLDEPGGDHVVYVGRLSREKGLDVLLEAGARARDPWPLHIVGTGPVGDALAVRARRLGIDRRVSFRPYVRDRGRLARLYARASVVCVPGRHETFGLAALEAAASGARTVTHDSAPSARAIGPALVDTYAGGSVDLLEAIERARRRPRELPAAAQLAGRFAWPAVFGAELADLETLVDEPRG